jgi:hypothetical protein
MLPTPLVEEEVDIALSFPVIFFQPTWRGNAYPTPNLAYLLNTQSS